MPCGFAAWKYTGAQVTISAMAMKCFLFLWNIFYHTATRTLQWKLISSFKWDWNRTPKLVFDWTVLPEMALCGFFSIHMWILINSFGFLHLHEEVNINIQFNTFFRECFKENIQICVLFLYLIQVIDPLLLWTSSLGHFNFNSSYLKCMWHNSWNPIISQSLCRVKITFSLQLIDKSNFVRRNWEFLEQGFLFSKSALPVACMQKLSS